MSHNTAPTDVRLGRRYRFIYPDYGTPDLHPDYTAHSGQLVTLVREILPPERDIEAGRTFEAKARDGWTGTVSIYELKGGRR